MPWAALALIMIPSIVLSWFYAYNPDFYGLTLDATLVIAVCLIVIAVAAATAPWQRIARRPELLREA